jgi:DNA polymerase-1
MRKPCTMLLDAEIEMYKVTTKCEVPLEWENDQWTLHSDAKQAFQMFDQAVVEIGKKINASQVIIALSDPGGKTFRHDIYSPYKASRKPTRKPLAYWPLRDYIVDHYDVRTLPKLEADDVLGILATNGEFENPIIVTEDKDLKTVAGRTYNPRKEQYVTTVKKWAHFNHMAQTLAGDPVDGYPGIKGIGMVTAAKILSSLPLRQWWPAVLERYIHAGHTAKAALVQAQCALILSARDWDAEKQQRIPWNPKNRNRNKKRGS